MNINSKKMIKQALVQLTHHRQLFLLISSSPFLIPIRHINNQNIHTLIN